MSDTLSTEIKPLKNSFGLPTGDNPLAEIKRETPVEEVVEEATEEVEEEVVEEEQEEEEVVEEAEEEKEEDILSLTLGEEEEAEPVSEESQVDSLRRELDVLKGRLQERSNAKDEEIVNEEVPEDDELDFSNPQFRDAISEKLQEDPSLMPVLVQEMVDRKLAAVQKKFEAQEAKARQTDVSIEQAQELKKNLFEGLTSAQELGDLEQKLVEQVAEASAQRDPSKSHVLMYLQQNPHFAQSAEGIKAAVTNLAAQARANAVKRGIDISTGARAQASDRSNRMMDKQTKPAEETSWEDAKIKKLLGSKKHPLDALMKGR